MSKLETIALETFGIKTISHMTHIKNLETILSHGLYAHNNPYKVTDISNTEVNDRRSVPEPVYNKPIHDYVPFYFNPRNAMLYRNQCHFGEDIIILGFSQDIILEENVLFTNNNASAGSAVFTNDASMLLDSKFINWDTVFSRRWVNYGYRDEATMQMMMAEVLVPKHVKSDKIKVIYCQCSSMKEKIEQNFELRGIKVVVDTSKFFRSQL